MSNSQEEKIPKVFISYSHDSPSHEKWVGEFASTLVRKGIDVIIDQWDLALGDDVPKFMETGVSKADRVLMICTENYVKKADEGKGGVGYEAMIVTGEIIADLGTSKFIPIIRQNTQDPILPKALSTRFYVNLSEGQNIEEQFEFLLRELHQMPTITKPPLGKNPFALQPSGAETPSDSVFVDISNFSKLSEDITGVYNIALDIARKGDLVAWRRMIRSALLPISQQLIAWRNKYEGNVQGDFQFLRNMSSEAVDIYAKIFSIALAGLESGREKFINQVGLIDEILNPRDWNPAGMTIIVDVPYTIAYAYQALNGAMCLQTHQLSLATKLAWSKIVKKYEKPSLPLYKHHEIIGWPGTLGGNCKEAWPFLTVLPERWNWLNESFGSADGYLEALCAYYIALNVIEFIDTIAEGQEDLLNQEGIMLQVPLCFLQENDEITKRAYRLFLEEPEQIKGIWLSKNVPENKVKALWPKWIHHLKYWLSRANTFGSYSVVHENLFEDID
ncbi:MAG TPA: toll/interleukin-1 receptor domain-containing protein [Smithella sp.]|nr:toll/interleukin-1 receptor domain-containing protein [Smithella sp.]